MDTYFFCHIYMAKLNGISTELNDENQKRWVLASAYAAIASAARLSVKYCFCCIIYQPGKNIVLVRAEYYMIL